MDSMVANVFKLSIGKWLLRFLDSGLKVELRLKTSKIANKYTYSYKFPTKMDKGIFYNKRLKLF